jgi:prepilin-type N-terminal cleavage/methylation domain-containing protein
MKKGRGFTIIELMIVVAILGIMASAAIPSWIKYVRRSRTIEAMMNIRKMYDGAVSYYVGEHADKTGGLQHNRFPDPAGPTPVTPPKGIPTLVLPSAWGTPEWSALDFAVNDPMRYSYVFESNGLSDSAAFAEMVAHGDLDGDGIYSTFERTCTGIVDGVMGGSGLVWHINELE